MEGKEEIRKRLLEFRDSISSKDWDCMSCKIMRLIQKSKIYNECDALLCYADYHAEVGTLLLIEDALLRGKRVFLPKVMESYNESKMDFFEISSTCELVEGYKTIKEPVFNPKRKFDYKSGKFKKVFMLVPGVAFDLEGNRIGYGKGYYDNYLKDYPEILTVGICFSNQILEKIPFEDCDIRLDYVISEKTSSDYIEKMHYKG